MDQMLDCANENRILAEDAVDGDLQNVLHVVVAAADDVDNAPGHQNHYSHGVLQAACVGLDACCFALKNVADLDYISGGVGVVDWGENCYQNSDDADVVVDSAGVDIHDANAAATNFFAVGAEVAVVERRFHFSERGCLHETVAFELVQKNPTVQFQLCSSRDLSRFVAQDHVHKN